VIDKQGHAAIRSYNYVMALFCFALFWAVIIPGAKAEVRRVLPESISEIKLSYAPLVAKVTPAVVNIYTKRVVKTKSFRSPFFDDPLFRHFFGDSFGNSAPRERVQRSLGSGVIVRSNGIIVTNNHVIGEADEITVALADRREFAAEVILTDERTDIAVLKIETKGEELAALSFNDSDNVAVGDLVLAVGNPFGVGQTVTSGIVSALARTQVGVSDYQFFIQTDAAVNPGNSGGALVDMTGQLIGVNTAIFSRSGGSNGIGFAVPANMVRYIVAAALADGKLTRPWLGAAGQTVTAEIAESLGLDRPGGVLVDDLYPGGSAARAGVRNGDIILSIDDKDVLDPQGLRYRIGTRNVGVQIDVRLMRAGRVITVPIVLQEAPEDPPRNETMIEGQTPFAGVKVANLSPAYAEEIGTDPFRRGVMVVAANRNSAVIRAGLLKLGDIIQSLNGIKIKKVRDIERALRKEADSYDIVLDRKGRMINCRISSKNRYYCR